jgi:hypothetical protein
VIADIAESPLRHARPLEYPKGKCLWTPRGVGGGFRPYRFELDKPVEIYVPKGRVENLEYRLRLVEACEGDEDLRETVRGICSIPTLDGYLFWLNVFGWTYHQAEIDAEGRQKSLVGEGTDAPFITWPAQDDVADTIIHGIQNGHDVPIHKGRDQGASWLILSIFHWMWQFTPNVNFMEMSRVEELVDNGPGDPSSLFWKHDFLNRMQPGWLVPPSVTRTHLHLVNRTSRSSIIGKSTSAEQGRAGRVTAVLIDEAALIRELQSIWVSMSRTTNCRIPNSTVRGPGYFSKIIKHKSTKRLFFWDHPWQGRGRYEEADAETGEVKVRSPWYDAEVARSMDRIEISQEIEGDIRAAGSVFFDPYVITRKITTECRPPDWEGELRFVGDGDIDIALRRRQIWDWGFVSDDEGAVDTRLKLWCDLWQDRVADVEAGCERLIFRPPQRATYVLGIDISHGMGSSESAIEGYQVETGLQVCEFADGNVSPDELARIAVALGHWLGGERGCAFLIWEANGAGGRFGQEVCRRLGYPWTFKHVDEKTQKQGKWDGWHSNPQRKRDMLGLTRKAWARSEQIVLSETVLEQAQDYVFLNSGDIGPIEMAEIEGSARATHGDRVIATGLARYGMLKCHSIAARKRKPHPMSVAGRMEAEAKTR